MSEKDYAIIKNDNVINVIVIDSYNQELLSYFVDFYNADYIIEASKKAQAGGTYDGLKFWPPQPYPSWTKNEELNEWEPPISYPLFDEENPKFYQWNEDILNWEEIQVSE
jgi:hypothetical protein